MKTLVVYDNQGYVIQQLSGSYRIPVGVPCMEVSVPNGKRIIPEIGVDVKATPHQPLFEDIPNYEIEEIKKRLTAMQEAIDFLIVNGGA